MIPSKSHISKQGCKLISDAYSPQEITEAFSEINEWRALHLKPLQELCSQLDSLFSGISLKVEFSSSRIKRMESIVDKLRNNSDKDMRLGGLDDIGGARYVFDGIDSLLSAYEALKSFAPDGFTLKRIRNYVYADDNGVGPKASGYRSIHFVYEYSSEDKTYDGLHVELQIRTLLQHSWAMAVETASMIDRVSLKADVDDGSEWREFFKLVSAIFSKEENMPVLSEFESLSSKELCNEYFRFNNKYKLLEQFRAMRAVTEKRPPLTQDGYYLLTLDLDKKVVSISSYPSASKDKAAMDFSDVEMYIRKDNKVALLVSLSKMTELRTAYPSYFLDTGQFLRVMKNFYDNCNHAEW